MKKTKTTNITRKFAAVIAAAIMMTTTASFAASANNAQVVKKMSVSSAMDNSKIYGQIVDLELEELFKCIDEFVPGGKFLTPVFKLVSNNILGKNNTVSLNDINAKLDDMFSKLDKLNADLKSSLENITAIQDFKSFHLTTFNSQIAEIISQIETIRKLDISEENKYAQIAALIGSNTSWTKSSNVFVTFSNVTQALNSPSLTVQGDLFELVYNHYSKTSMFSGEALDKASHAADLVMTDYMAGYYALMQCLSAQAKVCNMTAEQKSRIEPKYLSKICDNQQFITNKINQLKDCVMGNTTVRTERYITGYRTVNNIPSGCTVTSSFFKNKKVPVYATGPVVKYDSDSIVGKYNRFKTTDRLIFINNGTANDKLSEDLIVTNHNSIPLDLNNKVTALEKSTNYINQNACPSNLSGSKIKVIAAAALRQGLTVRQYLKKNGFNVDDLPVNSILITGRAYSDLEIGHVLTGLCGYAAVHASYKGINIDSMLIYEREVTYHHAGFSQWADEDWNFIESGNIVSFSTDKLSWDWLTNPVIC